MGTGETHTAQHHVTKLQRLHRQQRLAQWSLARTHRLPLVGAHPREVQPFSLIISWMVLPIFDRVGSTRGASLVNSLKYSL